ncbi:AAA family ATPase [Roseburia hominis]
MFDPEILIGKLPPMLSGGRLQRAMEVLPPYEETVKEKEITDRLIGLSDLYQIYLPSQMSQEIYSKLYLAMLRALRKKGTRLAIQQSNENYRGICETGKNRSLSYEYTGILGGSDSFTIIGTSGIGKSSAIAMSIRLMMENPVLELTNPYMRVLPCVVVQCPFDSSVKGMLLEILRKVDEVLETKYYEGALRARSTTDMLIGSVSQVCLNHVGLLVVDEIQNVAGSKNGKSLIGSLTQLINNSGISICMVGTPESTAFFEQAMPLARRSLGLQYGPMPYGKEFSSFCEVLFSYQYVREPSFLSGQIIEWLYEHSAGVVSSVVSLIHDAQEIAILDGREKLDIGTLNDAYRQRMKLLHGYIRPTVVHNGQCSAPKKKQAAGAYVQGASGVENGNSDTEEHLIAGLVAAAKAEQENIVAILKNYMVVTEVGV